MQLELPCGATWAIRDVPKKLAHRAALPGARLFDLAAHGLRDAGARGVSDYDRFCLALPASWLVNSPAISRVLRRWALAPHRDTALALLALLQEGPARWVDGPAAHDTHITVARQVASLGDEPYVTEAISKVLALLVPEMVPLMPAPARAFVLGAETDGSANAFVRMVDWFARTSLANAGELAEMARAHEEVPLVGAGVLDRLLWFDSEGHKHFPPIEAPIA